MAATTGLRDPAPEDGLLPRDVVSRSAHSAFGLYVHVPYCRVRCGYCDFNTYTASELGNNASQAGYAQQARTEMRFARDVLERSGIAPRPVSTVFFGGGTPTLLPTGDLAAMLNEIRELWSLEPDAEVTVEANPETVTEHTFDELAAAGFTRASIGMQSAVESVLRTLDRTHTPQRVNDAVKRAREAGLAVSVDLIYGAPGETIDDWRRSVEAALELEPDHISAYALIVEAGTKLAAQIARGEQETPDADLQAEMYELADALFNQAGLGWYEVSNWSRDQRTRSKHNLGYWQGADWWGIGPGAHSHIAGVRWFNVKHPRAYADRIAQGVSAAHSREVLTTAEQFTERVLLETRIIDGLAIDVLPEHTRPAVAELIADELIDARSALGADGTPPRIVPTLAGRLLADTVVHRLLRDNTR